MWGFGGRYYWGGNTKRERGSLSQGKGIVVVFAWMSSEEKHLKHYMDLYASLGWNSLVCHPQFFNSFFPEKATLLALDILRELIEELKTRPCPVVFASFSGGPKACMYKVLQIIMGKCDQRQNVDNFQIVRDCVAGHIYDSSPVDFTSDLGTRFILHPSVLRISNPPKLVVWIANGISASLDGLFLSRFESQRADYWRTLYSSVNLGAPYLIMCSEDDDLAPCEIVCNFAHRLQELGGDVRLMKWASSPHVGHYRKHPVEYTCAVTELLGKASATYSQSMKRHEGDKMGTERRFDEISEPQGDLRKAAMSSNDIFNRFSVGLEEESLVPRSNSCAYNEGRVVGSVQDEPEAGVIHLPTSQRIKTHGILGQILFDNCVPQDIEEWDVVPSRSSDRPLFSSTRRHAVHFNPIKCIRRSRL